MANKSNSESPWALLVTWILANLLGWAIGLAMGALLTQLASTFSWFNEDRGFAYTTLLSLGICVGTAQWFVLKRYQPRAWRWIIATILGYLLGSAIITIENALQLGRVGLWDDVLLFVLMGTALGVSQWWILRQSFQQAWLWVLMNAAGFLVFLIAVTNPAGNLSGLIFFGAVLGAVAAVLSGIALIWLVRQPLTPIPQNAA